MSVAALETQIAPESAVDSEFITELEFGRLEILDYVEPNCCVSYCSVESPQGD